MSVDSLDCNFSGEFDYLRPNFESLPAELTVDQRREVENFLFCNADVFSKHEYDLGLTDSLTFCIDTGDHRPIAQPLQPHLCVHLDFIDETVDKMLEAGVIEPASSPWSSNIVLVFRRGCSKPRLTK